MMIKNVSKPTPEFAKSKTVVWWDLDTCPLPNGYDPSRVVPRIDTELRNLGYNGPLTIVALGDLEGIPYDFLRVLSAAGVVIKHVPTGQICVMRNIYRYKESPMNIMVISGQVVVCALTDHLLKRGGGYNLLLAYPPTCPPEFPHPPSLVVCGEWLWIRASLLKDSGSDKQLRTLDKGREKFSCRSCLFECNGLEDLIKHFQTSKHLVEMIKENDNRECMFHVVARQEAEARKIAADEEEKMENEILMKPVKKKAEKKKAKKNAEEKSEANDFGAEDQMLAIPSEEEEEAEAEEKSEAADVEIAGEDQMRRIHSEKKRKRQFKRMKDAVNHATKLNEAIFGMKRCSCRKNSNILLRLMDFESQPPTSYIFWSQRWR